MGSTPTIFNQYNIEMVQRRAARWVKQDYRLTSSVSDMEIIFNGLPYMNAESTVD